MCLDEEGRSLVPFTPREEADWFAATLPAVLDLLVRHLPGGWTQRRGDSFGLLTHVPIATLNGVLSTSVRARADEAAALLDTVRNAGVPYSLQLRPESDGDLEAVAAAAGMLRSDDIPAMVLQDPSCLLSVAETKPLILRQLNPDELGTHLAVLAAGFQLPADVLAPLVWALRFTSVRHYVGEVNDEPVVTGTGIRFEDAVGIFNVATIPPHRRQSYATALTARAILEGFATGASRAFLQSTLMAEGLYRRIGFRTVERWKLWLGGLSPSPGFLEPHATVLSS